MVVRVITSIHSTPAERARHRHHDDERLEPGLKIRRHQQVDQQDREQNAQLQRGERLVHRLALTANRDMRARRQVAEIVDLALDGVAHAAEVAPGHARVNIHHALHRVMRDDRRIDVVRDSRDVAEHLAGGVIASAGAERSARRCRWSRCSA